MPRNRSKRYGKILGIWDRADPPTGAMPRFPVWEVVAMSFAVVYGVGRTISPGETSLYALLGNYSQFWFAALALGGLISLIGLAMQPINGLIINLVGCAILSITSLSVLAGLMVFYELIFFAGSLSLYVFGVGGFIRAIQLVAEMKQFERVVFILKKYEQLNKEGDCG